MTTKAQALDHLTDVLAGEDVAGEPTVAGAIDKLATMIENGEITIGGGGGGGVTVFEITIGDSGPEIDASYNDIANANYALFKQLAEDEVITPDSYSYYVADNQYGLALNFGGDSYNFVASTPDGNLIFTIG